MDPTADQILHCANTAKDLVDQSTKWILALQAPPHEWCPSEIDGSDEAEESRLARNTAGIKLWNAATTSQISDHIAASTIANCAHSPDVRFLASCGMHVGDWGWERVFRTGFDAAAYFGQQCFHFVDRVLDRIDAKNTPSEREADRNDACQMLFPCVCVEHLQTIIDYEAAWLLHEFCDKSEPRRWDLQRENWLTLKDSEQVAKDMVGPFEPKWLRELFTVEDNRTLKRRLGQKHKENSQRSWSVPLDVLNSLGDWKSKLRQAAESMNEADRLKVDSLLSVH